MTHSISLCIIAKDEAELLPRLLASVEGVVDETIVVDTGSTDETAAIARRLGARVITKPFQDDFSEVRNAGLDAASHPWILVLDADEILADGSGDAIRRAVRDERFGGYHLNFQNHLGGGRVHACSLARLFRNAPEVRFRYFIHEQIVPSLIPFCRARGLKLGTLDDAVVHHDGYLPSRYRSREKDLRNERLFRHQLEAYPDHAYSWYKFGDFLRRFDDRRDDARRALARAAELVLATPADVAKDLAFANEVFGLLGLVTEQAGDPTEALELVERGIESFGASPNLLYVRAYLLGRAGRHREAFRDWARLRTFEGMVLPIPPEPGITGPKAFLGLGMSLAQLGHSVAAGRCLEHALARDPTLTDAYVARARLHLDAGDVPAAIDQYRAALTQDEDAHPVRARLAVALAHQGHLDEAEQQLLQAKQRGARPAVFAARLGEYRVASGDLEGAFQAFLEAKDDPEARAGVAMLAALAEGKPAPESGHAITQRMARSLARLGLS